MCGIAGYVGYRKASEVLVRSLKRLEYRGYDSCGIATIHDGRIEVRKDRGTVDEVSKRLRFEELGGTIGIAHTRWATHGKPNQENAHPHLSCEGDIAIIHNGIISNYAQLRKELEARGHSFRSETDSEIFAHLVEDYLGRMGSLEEAVRQAARRLEGTFAILVISSREPDKIVCVRKESPLLIGVGRGEMFAGSDATAFLDYTKKAIPLEDGELAVLTKDGWRITDLDGRLILREPITLDWDISMAEKGGYEHFMLKEIHEQPSAIRNALNVPQDDIIELARMIMDSERTILVATGTSLHAAMVAQYWFSILANRLTIPLDSSEFPYLCTADRDTTVIAITQSGETYDTLSAMRHAKKLGCRVGAIVNVVGSTATRIADKVVIQGSGPEIAVCATKTYTSQLTILLRIAIELAKMVGNSDLVLDLEREISKLPEYVSRSLEKEDEIKEVANRFCRSRNYIFISRGINLPSALEGALKFKEITYLHAEGMSGGFLKHGTISLIDENMEVVAIIPPDGTESRRRLISNIEEVKAREGIVIGIASGSDVEICDACITVPLVDELLSPIVLAPPLQLLAYYTARKLGREIDKPRALAKSVTVE